MNILIVEDEMVVAADLQDLLASYGFPDTTVAINYTEAIAALESQPVHLVLLDIHLGGYKTGIDVAQYIRDRISVPFIFLTAYEDLKTVNAALATSPHAYLQKPFGSASLYAAIQLAINNFKKAQDSTSNEEDSVIIQDAFFVKVKNGYSRVGVQDVQYIRSDGNYMELHTSNKKHLVRISQKALLAKLPDSFMKANKSYIVNSTFITAIGSEAVSLGEVSIPLAPNYRNELLEKLQKFS